MLSCPYHTFDALRPSLKSFSCSSSRGCWKSDPKSPARGGDEYEYAHSRQGWRGGGGEREWVWVRAACGERHTEERKVGRAEPLDGERGRERRIVSVTKYYALFHVQPRHRRDDLEVETVGVRVAL